MSNPELTPDLEKMIRQSVEKAVRETLAEQMPAIRAQVAEQARGQSPLTSARKAVGMNQSDLAEATELSQGTISRIESGQLHLTYDQAMLMAQAIKANSSSFSRLTGTGEPELARLIWLAHGKGADTEGFDEIINNAARSES